MRKKEPTMPFTILRPTHSRLLGSLLLLFAAALGSAAAVEKGTPSDAKVVPRLAPGDVLKRASKAWEDIRDFQGILHQNEIHPNGQIFERWAKITLIKNPGNDPSNPPIFLVNFYDHTVALDQPAKSAVGDGTPTITYFSDNSRRLYTYEPNENSLTIEWLDEAGPLPEFLYIAGFVDYNLDELQKKVFLDDEVWAETIDGKTAYRVKAVPRKKMRDTEPDRLIWIGKDDNMIKRFAVEGDAPVQVDFQEFKINQGLSSGDLIPEIPADAYPIDKTQSSGQ